MPALLKYNLGVCLVLFAVLEFWRPYFFLTDDNFSALWPILTEIGRHLKAGESPFISHYIFGGHFNLSRDVSSLVWHPFYMLPALLADTPGRFAMIDLIALFFFILTTVGFTFLAEALVREFNPGLPVIYIVFYTASFLFSSFIFFVGSSWLQFLGNQSALPWLLLGILDRRLLRGTLLVLVFSLHEILSSYAPSILANGLCLSVFAVGVSIIRRSFIPVSSWAFGNILALLTSSFFLVSIMEGFARSDRAGGLPLKLIHEFGIRASIYPFSFFIGNWSGPLAAWGHFHFIKIHQFPHSSLLLACAAAWCLLPALINRAPWRSIEITCAIGLVVTILLASRPLWLSIAMSHLIFIRSMRFPFRECLQLLFFFHLFLLIRPPWKNPRWPAAIALFSLAAFVLPLPFDVVPTFKALAFDRADLFSGKAEMFWAKAKTEIKPEDNVATIIPLDLWAKDAEDVPYLMIGTANFPAFLKIICISGYAPTAPMDQVPLKTPIWYWFGAFNETQIPDLLKERPDLKLIEVEDIKPLRIHLLFHGQTTDLSPDVPR